MCMGASDAHDNGVIHQDVKPSNILITNTQIPKITDFGISKAVKRSSTHAAGKGLSEFQTGSSNGYTLAYCSPEQFNHEELQKSTDIWSFGVMLMEMLKGKPVTELGYLADEALLYDLDVNPSHPFPPIPASLVQLLKLCLKKNPSTRWKSFNELCEMLEYIYREETSQKFPKQNPGSKKTFFTAHTEHDRRTTTGYSWDDPKLWLEKAFIASGRDPSGMEDLIPQQSGSRQSQALVDLEIYNIAQICTNLLVPFRVDKEFAQLLMNKALIHENTSDWKQAIETRDRAIKIYEECVYRGTNSNLENQLAEAYVTQGWF